MTHSVSKRFLSGMHCSISWRVADPPGSSSDANTSLRNAARPTVTHSPATDRTHRTLRFAHASLEDRSAIAAQRRKSSRLRYACSSGSASHQSSRPPSHTLSNFSGAISVSKPIWRRSAAALRPSTSSMSTCPLSRIPGLKSGCSPKALASGAGGTRVSLAIAYASLPVVLVHTGITAASPILSRNVDSHPPRPEVIQGRRLLTMVARGP